MLQRDLLHQLPQTALAGFAFHAVDLFHLGGVHELRNLAAKSQTPAGDDHLVAFFIDHTQDVVVDDLLMRIASPSSPPGQAKKITSPLKSHS